MFCLGDSFTQRLVNNGNVIFFMKSVFKECSEESMTEKSQTRLISVDFSYDDFLSVSQEKCSDCDSSKVTMSLDSSRITKRYFLGNHFGKFCANSAM